MVHDSRRAVKLECPFHRGRRAFSLDRREPDRFGPSRHLLPPRRRRITMRLSSPVVRAAVSALFLLPASMHGQGTNRTPSQASSSGTPTLAIVNARIWTGDSRRPWADGIAVTGERIALVGTSAAVRKLVAP